MSSLCPNEAGRDWTNTTRAHAALHIHDPIKVVWCHFQSKFDQTFPAVGTTLHLMFQPNQRQRQKKKKQVWYNVPKSDRCAGISMQYLDCVGEQGEDVCVLVRLHVRVQSLKPTLTNKHMLIMEEITGRSSSTLPLKRSKMHDCRAQPELVMGITPCQNTTTSLSLHLTLPLSPQLFLSALLPSFDLFPLEKVENQHPRQLFPH